MTTRMLTQLFSTLRAHLLKIIMTENLMTITVSCGAVGSSCPHDTRSSFLGPLDIVTFSSLLDVNTDHSTWLLCQSVDTTQTGSLDTETWPLKKQFKFTKIYWLCALWLYHGELSLSVMRWEKLFERFSNTCVSWVSFDLFLNFFCLKERESKNRIHKCVINF